MKSTQTGGSLFALIVGVLFGMMAGQLIPVPENEVAAFNASLSAQRLPNQELTGYNHRFAATVRANIGPVNKELVKDARALVEVRTVPDGTIVGTKVIGATGNLGWGAVVQQAIWKVGLVPKDAFGQVPAVILISISAD